MAFLDVSFPRDVARGAMAIPTRRTEVVSVGAGIEERNQRWADSRRTFQAGLGLRSGVDLAAVVALFEEARGRRHSFRFRDWTDYSSATPGASPSATDQAIGLGDGVATAFQLVKMYGSINPYARAITKPVAGSVLVALAGVPAASGWSVDHATGLVTFTTPPAVGVEVRAGFLFDVAVRFESDTLPIDVGYFRPGSPGVGSAPDIGLVEVRE